MRFLQTISLLLFVGCAPLSATETDASQLEGLWHLTGGMLYENGKAQIFDPAKEGPIPYLQHINVVRKDDGYLVDFGDSDMGKNSILLTVKQLGPNFLATGTLKSTGVELQLLIGVEQDRARVCLQKSGTPKDFSSPNDNSEKMILNLTRHRPGTLVIYAPAGTLISCGGFSQAVVASPMEVDTVPIPTMNVTLFEVTASINAQGNPIVEKQSVPVRAGEKVEFDFRDIQNPDVPKRTLRYWTACVEYYRTSFQKMNEEKSAATNTKQLRLLAYNLRTLPVRGVDKDAVEGWNQLASASERLANYGDSSSGWEVNLEAFVRGFTGDPFGMALEQKDEFDKLSKQFLEVDTSIKELAVRLSARHEIQLSQP